MPTLTRDRVAEFLQVVAARQQPSRIVPALGGAAAVHFAKLRSRLAVSAEDFIVI